MYKEEKTIIYQILPRLFANTHRANVHNGTLEQNGVGKMNSINSNVLKSITAMGVTHVWYTGIIEHANKTDYHEYGISRCNPHVVKGNAGSPYAIIDYYDVDPDIAVDVPGRMREFEELVARTHQAGLKVIIDFVPNHVAREYHSDNSPEGVVDLGAADDTTKAFARDNNFYYFPGERFDPYFDTGMGTDSLYFEMPARATGNDCFTSRPGVNDWYETVKLNYGVDYVGGTGNYFDPIPDTWKKMLEIMKFWVSKRVDGFRCDMAHMVPIEFWHWAIPQIRLMRTGFVFIAELYDPNLYRPFLEYAGFDYLYDKVGLYDTLSGVVKGYRAASDITYCWQSLEGIADRMLNFMENHDEVRLASDQFAGSGRAGLPAVVVSATLNKSPFMLYFGQEIGERGADSEGYSGYDGRTTIFDYWSVDSLRRFYNQGRCNNTNLNVEERYLRKFYRHLLHIANSERAVAWGSMYDLMYLNMDRLNPHRHYVYLRHYNNEIILVAVNFDNNIASLDINIPCEVLDFIGIAPGTYQAKELLHGNDKRDVAVDGTSPFHVEIAPTDAVMWKWRGKRAKK